MKRPFISSALSLAVIIASGATHAGTQADSIKQGTLLGGGAILGAVIGGPFGLVAGATLGAVVGKDITAASAATGHPSPKQSPVELSTEFTALDDIINSDTPPPLASQAASVETTDLAPLAVATEPPLPVNLPAEVHFEPSSDQLTEEGRAIIEILAAMIKQEEGVKVELVGHTDPRGTDEFNNVLSQYRALTVQDQLIELGVSPHKLMTRGEGSNYSTAAKGDREGYAFERRVDIIIYTDDAIALQP